MITRKETALRDIDQLAETISFMKEPDDAAEVIQRLCFLVGGAIAAFTNNSNSRSAALSHVFSVIKDASESYLSYREKCGLINAHLPR